MLNSISFCGRGIYNPKKLFGDLSAGEIAEAYKLAHKKAGEALGLSVSPVQKTTAGELVRINPDSFDKRTHKLTQAGKDGFNRNNKDLEISTQSKTSEVVEAIKDFIVETCYDEGDGTGTITRSFNYFA